MKRSILRISRSLVVGMALLVLVAMPRASFGQAGLIQTVQINQGLGNNGGKFVAGKDAAILIILNQPTAVDAGQQSVIVKLGDATVATLQPVPSADPVATMAFVCPSRPACGDWKAGNYTFDVNINGSTSQATANFQERKGLKVLAVPVKANYGTGKIAVPTDTWKGLGEFARKVYPISPDRFEWNTGPEVDASDDKYNLATDEGQNEVFNVISGLQPTECRQKPRPAGAQGCYDMIIGFVKDRMGADGTTQGIAIPGAGANVSVESDEDAAGTVAHEIGHEYLLGDEYQGGSFRCDNNAPPPDYVGSDWNDGNNKNFSCPNSTSTGFPAGSGSTVKASSDFPYDIGGAGLLPDMMSFMGSGSRQNQIWITPAAWNRIFDGLAPQGGTFGYTRSNASLLAQESRWIFAEGLISKDDRVLLSPWESYEDSAEYENTTGNPYTLRAVDANGTTLASTALEVDFHILDSPGAADKAYFEADMPFPDGTTAFQILKGNKVLSERRTSDNAPTLRVTAPAAGEVVSSSTYKIKWEAADKDGDKLTYDVEYSTDGEEWDVLAVDVDETELVEDFSDLPGTGKASVRIRVTASDGINAGEADSGLFSVPVKAPEVSIERPQSNQTFKAGTLVSLQGVAYDVQDGDITESQQLVWTSDLQGELGKGTLLNLTNLKPGKHTITLKATNSAKLSGISTVVVNISDKATQPSCTTFKETGKTVCDKFLAYWNSHGGLAQQGFPISSEMQEKSDTDGKVYTVQYFERAVFEMHPENTSPNDVLLSLLGNFLYKEKYPNGASGQAPDTSAGSVLFRETGKYVGGKFLEYWQTHGGLAQQGYPISDVFQEKSALDGKVYTVQYFERAVFEMHPENPKPYDVLLSQLGTFRFREKYLVGGR